MAGLSYPTIQTRPIIGSKSGTTRTSVALPTSYDAVVTKTFSAARWSKLNLDILYTMGAAETANTIETKVEGSPDGTNFYRIPNESVASGTSSLFAREFTFLGADAAAATISIGLDIFYKYVKVSCKETGVAANAGTVYVEATLSGQ